MRIKLLLSGALIGAVSCSGDSPTAPLSSAPASANYGVTPGSARTGAALSGKFTPINCAPRRSAVGTALIGPSGGTLWVGPHRLIVPAGALTQKVQISGTVPEGKPFEINLEPHGLQFRKPAGLILDASSCIKVPTIVYLIDQYTVSPPIPAIYSNWWHMIACPIWHFSGYAVALGDEGGLDEASAQ